MPQNAALAKSGGNKKKTSAPIVAKKMSLMEEIKQRQTVAINLPSDDIL